MPLTSDKDKQSLEKVEVKGRTVHVSQRTNSAFIEFEGELISMTNLNAWNHLMEEAKKKALDNYDRTKSMEEKMYNKKRNHAADEISEMRRELARLEGKLRSEE